MPSFEISATCRARPEEVFKLLWDPSRFPDWWAGMDRVEAAGEGNVNRYMSAWPDFAYPTRVTAGRDTSNITISCLLSDIAHEWGLSPHQAGCEVHVRVDVPEVEASRLDDQRTEVNTSLERLIALAEAETT